MAITSSPTLSPFKQIMANWVICNLLEQFIWSPMQSPPGGSLFWHYHPHTRDISTQNSSRTKQDAGREAELSGGLSDCFLQRKVPHKPEVTMEKIRGGQRYLPQRRADEERKG